MLEKIKKLADMQLQTRYNPCSTHEDYLELKKLREAVFIAADEGELGEVSKRPLTDEAIVGMLEELAKKAGEAGDKEEAIGYGLAVENIRNYIEFGNEETV